MKSDNANPQGWSQNPSPSSDLLESRGLTALKAKLRKGPKEPGPEPSSSTLLSLSEDRTTCDLVNLCQAEVFPAIGQRFAGLTPVGSFRALRACGAESRLLLRGWRSTGTQQGRGGDGEGDPTSAMQPQRLLVQIPPALKTWPRCLLSRFPHL